MTNNSDIADAARLLKEAEQKKVEACSLEINDVLRKYGCIMQPQVIIRGIQIIPQVLIIPNPTPNQQPQMRSPKDGSDPG